MNRKKFLRPLTLRTIPVCHPVPDSPGKARTMTTNPRSRVRPLPYPYPIPAHVDVSFLLTTTKTEGQCGECDSDNMHNSSWQRQQCRLCVIFTYDCNMLSFFWHKWEEQCHSQLGRCWKKTKTEISKIQWQFAFWKDSPITLTRRQQLLLILWATSEEEKLRIVNPLIRI